MEVKAITYGGIITSLKVPDKAGQLGDVVLGYDTLQGYLDKSPFFGTIVGRYGNRIGKGTFTIDGKTYTLPINNGENHLHGGPQGFDKAKSGRPSRSSAPTRWAWCSRTRARMATWGTRARCRPRSPTR